MRTADVFSFIFITLLFITKASDSSHLDNGTMASEWEGLLSSASNDPSIDHADEDHQQFTAGFSSLDGMLQWAIGHSDPATLKEKSNHVQSLSSDDIMERQTQIKDLVGKLSTPSDGELMKIAIADLNNSSNISLEDYQRALDELLILVEPIHNANDEGMSYPCLAQLVENGENGNVEVGSSEDDGRMVWADSVKRKRKKKMNKHKYKKRSKMLSRKS